MSNPMPDVLAQTVPAALPSGPPSPPAARKSSMWPMASVLIVLLLVVGIPLGYVVISWSHAAINAPARLGTALSEFAADAVRPQVTINEIVINSIQDLHKKSKLVVFDAVVSADVTRDESSSSWGVYWGTNVARVIVRDAHVQYCIDLSKLGPSDFEYNERAKTLTIGVPKPRIDTQMVAIDPARIETLDLRGGWLRWDKQDTKDHALTDLKPQVIIQANAPYIQELAQNAGTQAMTNFLTPLADTLSKDGVTLKVEYRPAE